MKHKKLSQKWQGICEYKYSLRQTHKKTKTGEAKILHKANSPWQEIAFLFHYCMSVLPNLYKFSEHIDIKLSRGEIRVANFIPPANGASQGIYFLAKVWF